MTPVELTFALLGAVACVLAIVAEMRLWRLRAELVVARYDALDAMYHLADIRRQRSETTRRGNETKAAKRKETIEVRADELRRNVVERVTG